MSSNPSKLLVVAAWEPELTRFRELLASSTLAAHAHAAHVVLDTVGVGVVEAAVGMTRALERHRPALAVLLGTAGALPGATAPAIGDVIAASTVRITDRGLVDGAAQLPPPMPSSVTLDADVLGTLVAVGARAAVVANTLGITVDDVLASSLARGAGHANDVEHLEAFAFARACAAFDVPCAAVFGIANTVGARGRGEWLANHVAASTRAADVAFAALPALGAWLRTRTRAPSTAPA